MRTDEIYDIDYYLNDNQLNKKLYQTLLFLQDNSENGRVNITIQPLLIFNSSYDICDLVKEEKHPENLTDKLWDRMSQEYTNPELSVLFSVVYVILTFTASNNPNMVFFLTRIKHLINESYFSVFEPLLEEELFDFPELPKSFSKLKSLGDKIDDLDERELFYSDYITRYKQSKNKGNIIQQLNDEVELIQKKRQLEGNKNGDVQIVESKNATKGSNKVKTAVLLELLNKIGKGKSQNDLSKICRLVAYLTGGSEAKIYNDAQGGIQLTNYHNAEIQQVNGILKDLGLEIKLKKDVEY